MHMGAEEDSAQTQVQLLVGALNARGWLGDWAADPCRSRVSVRGGWEEEGRQGSRSRAGAAWGAHVSRFRTPLPSHVAALPCRRFMAGRQMGWFSFPSSYNYHNAGGSYCLLVNGHLILLCFSWFSCTNFLLFILAPFQITILLTLLLKKLCKISLLILLIKIF